LGPNLQGNVVSAPLGKEYTPEAEEESNLEKGEIRAVGEVI